MKILGLGCGLLHDPSAALLVDGELVAAAEEERFSRRKHAVKEEPVEAARWCLAQAGVKPDEVDVIAYPWSAAIMREKRWEYARRMLGRSATKAIRPFKRLAQEEQKRRRVLEGVLRELKIDPASVQVEYVEHHVAHAASAFHLSGFPSAAVLTADGEGELTSTLFLEGLPDGRMKKLKEVLKPDSLGLFYSTITEYLGFDAADGEYKVMGMAPYGDPTRYDLSKMLWLTDDGGFRCDDERVWVERELRVVPDKHISQRLIDELGPPRQGDDLHEPYVHVAAATQKLLEEVTVTLVERHLGDALKRHGGRLCFAGGVALNVKLNKRLIEHPLVDELFVQPASGDSGVALGAAAYAAALRGERVRPMGTAALGPSFTTEQVREVLDGFCIPYEVLEDAPATAADLLAKGEVVAWFQGRMEWGPRALGQRSILGNPTVRGTADDINRRIKYREPWRPFCPSMLAEKAHEVLETHGHDSPYMTFCFSVRPEWKDRVPEIVHVDGTARPQFVTPERAPRFHRLISAFERRTGIPVVINTSLNRRGEPLICSPEDALQMFFASGLEYLVIEDVLVRKRPAAV
ncbi:MAG: carbamoyltransferase [Planctomycetes bacterium]|nr:carbamoyltransferase [Planctomycetota bacterium]